MPKFFIYPDSGKLRVQVTVVGGTRKLRRVYTERTGKTCDKVLAFFQQQKEWTFAKKGSAGVRTGLVGEIVLSEEHLQLDTIVHECGHAAHSFCRRKRKTDYGKTGLGGIDGSMDHPEEVFCYALGSMVSQICDWLCDHDYRWKKTKKK